MGQIRWAARFHFLPSPAMSSEIVTLPHSEIPKAWYNVLADLPTPELQSYIEGGLPRLTGYTLVDPDALKADLALVSSRGYATTWEEQEPGLTAVAAPIRATDGHLVAAVSVSGR